MWQQIAPIWLLWGKSCHHSSAFDFDWILFILVGSEGTHKISNVFEIHQDPTKLSLSVWKNPHRLNLARSFLTGSSIFLQLIGATIKASMSLNFGQIPLPIKELTLIVLKIDV